MEKTTIYFKDGKFIEYPNYDGNNVASMISGDHLMVTTKSTQETENGPIRRSQTEDSKQRLSLYLLRRRPTKGSYQNTHYDNVPGHQIQHGRQV